MWFSWLFKKNAEGAPLTLLENELLLSDTTQIWKLGVFWSDPCSPTSGIVVEFRPEAAPQGWCVWGPCDGLRRLIVYQKGNTAVDVYLLIDFQGGSVPRGGRARTPNPAIKN